MFKFFTYTLLTVLTVDLLATCGDVTLSWTSPVLPKLHSANPHINPFGRPITQVEESWIAAAVNIGAVAGCLPIGYISAKFGRKITLLAIAVPFFASSIILALIPNVYFWYFARFLAGFSGGASCSILPLYIAEIAEDSNRGTLSVTLNVFWTLGSLIPYVIGPYMSIKWFNLTLACIPALFFLLFLTVAPESPYYLVSKNQIHKAEESLMKLRSRSRSSVAKELANIQSASQGDTSAKFLDLFNSKANCKAMFISTCLLVFQQLSGINAVLCYTQLIFEVAGSSLSPEISALIIGVVFFVSSLIVPFVTERLDRRVFLIISALGLIVSLTALGAYFYAKDTLQVDVSSFSSVPIVALVAFIITFNLGFACLPWTISSELLPVNVKVYGAPLVSLFCWISSFLVTKFFNDLNNALGIAGTFWLFAGFCGGGLLFTVLVVPETRGKSFKEIQEMLQK